MAYYDVSLSLFMMVAATIGVNGQHQTTLPVLPQQSTVATATAAGQQQSASVIGCPTNCECDENLSSTVCSRRSLSAIPPVPITSLYAYFDRNIFANPYLTAGNFSSIPYVRGLYLKGCGLANFEVNTFTELKFLRELDLSYNKIAFIPRGAFANLQLEFLDLGYNPAIRLMPDSFCGASISRLSLKCCDLESINVQTFHPLFDSITSLTLSCNDLDTIPASMVWSPSHLNTLNIADNPRLTCDCNMLWISRRLSLQKQLFKVDYAFPRECAIDSLVIRTGSSSLSSSSSNEIATSSINNCSTDAIMLKQIDHGLCVRTLEALRTLLPPTTLKPKRNKTTTHRTTTTFSLAHSGSSKVKENDLSLEKELKQELSSASREVQSSSSNSKQVVDEAPTIGNKSDCGNNAGVTTRPSLAQPAIVTVVDPSTRYTRAHMFVACVASATFTFATAILCYCANRVCNGWLSEHRRRISAKRQQDEVWGKSCGPCSTTHPGGVPNIGVINCDSSSTRQPSTTTTTSTTASHAIGSRFKHAAMMMRPSVSYPSDDLNACNIVGNNNIRRSPSLNSETSSPLCVIGKTATLMSTSNKQTLHVRIAGDNHNQVSYNTSYK